MASIVMTQKNEATSNKIVLLYLLLDNPYQIIIMTLITIKLKAHKKNIWTKKNQNNTKLRKYLKYLKSNQKFPFQKEFQVKILT